jgi:hypothetical protein
MIASLRRPCRLYFWAGSPQVFRQVLKALSTPQYPIGVVAQIIGAIDFETWAATDHQFRLKQPALAPAPRDNFLCLS